MQVLQEKNEVSSASGRFIDIETIRRRVARVKNHWSPETTKARAIEGDRRRSELESLLLEYICDTEGSEELCDLKQHGFSLVG